jgi:ferric-dicitrate binding protein FerR (iron transport regulator)
MRAIKLQPNARPTAASDDRRPALTLLRLNTRSWVGIAASFALLVLAFQWFVPVTMQALPGEQASFVLPDGSAVEVNSETHLAYARPLRAAFDATRTVELRGEAFFSVRKSDKPFVVAVENASVRVVGTQFNVQSRLVGGVPRTSVAVVEGHVILNNTSGASMDLTAGAFAVVDAQEAPVLESASPARIAGWKEGTLALIDLPLGDLLDELERRFDRTVEVAGGVNLTNRKTAYYSAERSLESILADLCFSEKLAYKPIANGFRIELP